MSMKGAGWFSRVWQRQVAATVAAAAVAMSVAASPASGQGIHEPTPGVVPPSSTVQGLTYSQWSAAQWQWELQQQQVTDSPVVDASPGTKDQPEGVRCALGQSGSVWFLAGITFLQSYKKAYRSCSIPSGVYLFFPVVDAWSDDLSCPGTPPGDLTGDQLQQLVQQQTNTIVPNSMSVTIDGLDVNGLKDSMTAYRAAANGFSYTLPSNNALSAFCPGNPFPAGTTPPNPPGAYADGVYVMLTPLAAGVHHIHFAAQERGTPTFGPVTQNVFYTITVTN
jgi:hypothetical protein